MPASEEWPLRLSLPLSHPLSLSPFFSLTEAGEQQPGQAGDDHHEGILVRSKLRVARGQLWRNYSQVSSIDSFRLSLPA